MVERTEESAGRSEDVAARFEEAAARLGKEVFPDEEKASRFESAAGGFMKEAPSCGGRADRREGLALYRPESFETDSSVRENPPRGVGLFSPGRAR